MFLNPALIKVTGSTQDRINAILKEAAGEAKTNTLMVSLVAHRQESLLSAGLKGAKLMSELLTDPLVQKVIKEGISAVPNILNAYAKDGTHGAALWVEMLKQIKAIHDHSTDPNQEKQEFEDWLSSYLKPEAPAAPTEEAAPTDLTTLAVNVEQLAVQDDQKPAEGTVEE